LIVDLRVTVVLLAIPLIITNIPQAARKVRLRVRLPREKRKKKSGSHDAGPLRYCTEIKDRLCTRQATAGRTLPSNRKRPCPICVVADLQHVQQFKLPPLIAPCLDTIRNQDLMVPFEGLRIG
jgi:hypothetical protein